MNKIVLIMIILFTCIISFSFNGFAEDINEEEIKELIYDFISSQRDIRIYGDSDISILQNNIKCSEEAMTNALNDSLNKHDLDQLSGFELVSHNTVLHDFKFSQNEQNIVVTFLEDYKEVFKRFRGYQYTKDGISHTVNPGSYRTTEGKDRENEVTLIRQDNGLEIIDHKVYEFVVEESETENENNSLNSLEENREYLRNIFPNIDQLPDRPVDKYEIKIIKARASDETQKSTVDLLPLNNLNTKAYQPPACNTWTWNGNAAADYSDAYASSPNQSYRFYAGNDCTNFASQSLAAGGKCERTVPGGVMSDESWFYGPYTFLTSYSWAGSNNLCDHLYNHTNTVDPTDIDMIQRGDLIFIDKTTNGTMNHTMIIAKMYYDPAWPDAEVNYHSINTHRKSVLEVMTSYPNGIIRIALIGNSYN